MAALLDETQVVVDADVRLRDIELIYSVLVHQLKMNEELKPTLFGEDWRRRSAKEVLNRETEVVILVKHWEGFWIDEFVDKEKS